MALQKENAFWNIFWNEYVSDTYLYGSEIVFKSKNHVEYKNGMMPPGTIIKKWSSQTNFQEDKIEPALPIIDGEGDYELIANIEVDKVYSIIIQLVFFNRYGDEVGSEIISDLRGQFRCPLSTYSYELQLINGGATEFVFHSIVIKEVSE